MSHERAPLAYRDVLNDALTWVCAAHDATGRRGVSAGYDLRTGWQPTYPETSGYLIPTLLRGATALDRPELADRAAEIGEWLLDLQRPDGSFPGGTGVDGPPVVFDTGQILLGLLALWRATGEQPLLDTAVGAGDWLLAAQQPTGAWLSHFDTPNTYSSRVTWALAELWRATGEPAYLAGVRRSLDWLLDQVRPDGWIDAMAFSADHTAWTHTIGYALRGLLRCADLVATELPEPARRGVDAAVACAVRLAALRTDLHPLLPGEIGPGFTPLVGYACLTGDAQLVTIWLDVARRTGDETLRERCGAVLDRLAQLQVRQPLEPATVGALAGSWPLSGGFEPLAFPNWAAKFLADAVLEHAADVRLRRAATTPGGP
ncbi:beta-L-arabinofuranosidase domain-containing protein [Micromonospora fluostatini]|uniref:beta-L-arabinofuranosidase domain-containing protein n=1 Tax=Micromonospora sp. JCM 30529 TaxID=3421643 RepID=UPI003D170938